MPPLSQHIVLKGFCLNTFIQQAIYWPTCSLYFKKKIKIMKFSFKISIESSESNLVNFIKVSLVKRSESGSIKFVKISFVKRSESGSVDLIKVFLLLRPFCKGTESCPVQLIEISFSEGVTARRQYK